MALLPFNKPSLAGREVEYLRQSVASGWISGDGEFTVKCQAWLERALGVPKVLLTTSCTHALETAALLLDLKAGDEVIVPSFTFVSTVNAFALRGATPVFIDIRPDTLNLDETKLRSLISPRTRAIIPVHYAGVGCEMNEILAVAREHEIPVVEDNAHGLFGKYSGRALGTLGACSTLSFHETKNITCGEGGALVLNEPALIERAEVLRSKGTNRSQFFRGLVDKYTWVDLGSSYLPSDLLAAYLYAQLEEAESIQNFRCALWGFYFAELKDWAAENRVCLPQVPAHCEQAYHMFYLILPSLAARQAFIAHMRNQGIMTVFHYVPLHTSPMGRKFGGRLGDCPVTEDISDRLVRLPFFNSMTGTERELVVEAVRSFRGV